MSDVSRLAKSCSRKWASGIAAFNNVTGIWWMAGYVQKHEFIRNTKHEKITAYCSANTSSMFIQHLNGR